MDALTHARARTHTSQPHPHTSIAYDTGASEETVVAE